MHFHRPEGGNDVVARLSFFQFLLLSAVFMDASCVCIGFMAQAGQAPMPTGWPRDGGPSCHVNASLSFLS